MRGCVVGTPLSHSIESTLRAAAELVWFGGEGDNGASKKQEFDGPRGRGRDNRYADLRAGPYAECIGIRLGYRACMSECVCVAKVQSLGFRV